MLFCFRAFLLRDGSARLVRFYYSGQYFALKEAWSLAMNSHQEKPHVNNGYAEVLLNSGSERG